MIERRTVLKTGAAAMATLAMSDGTTKAQGGARSADVIVIGAGLAGLNATLLLEEMGYSVTLLEGRDRVGGRLYTMDDVPGAPEAGGAGIGSSYGRLLDAAQRFDIPLGNERARTIPPLDATILNIQGENIQLGDWADHAKNPFPGAHREKLPWQFQYRIYAEDNPFTDPAQFVDPKYAPQDISSYEYLRQKGFSHRAIELGASTNVSYGDEMGAHGISTLLWYNVLTFGAMNGHNILPGSPFAGKGGNQRIPEGMARHVKTDIQFSAKVVGIRSEKDHAEVRLADGRRLDAKRVIVTTPFSALRLIALDAPITPMQSLAITSLGYTNVTHLHFLPKKKFWEMDGMGASMWTDGPAARFMALRNNPDNPEEITSFIAFANNQTANHLDRLGPDGAANAILSYLEQIRPSTKGALEFIKFWSWQLDPFAGGAYAAWRPGQLSTFGRDMAQPAGRIHFAGEHTGQASRGMESAMESGERAAFEVADSI